MEKMLLPGLKQEMYKMSLVPPIAQEVRQLSETIGLFWKDSRANLKSLSLAPYNGMGAFELQKEQYLWLIITINCV